MKYMPVREFLRGGYQRIAEPTVISSRGYVLFTVFPGPPRVTLNKPSESFTDADSRDTVREGPPGPSPNGG